MPMPSSAFCTSFQKTCKDYLKPWEFDAYCKPLCERAERAYQSAQSAADWMQKKTTPIADHAKWTWEKTGEYYGVPGQMVLFLLVAGISYNLYHRLFGKKNEISREEMHRLLQEQAQTLRAKAFIDS